MGSNPNSRDGRGRSGGCLSRPIVSGRAPAAKWALHEVTQCEGDLSPLRNLRRVCIRRTCRIRAARTQAAGARPGCSAPPSADGRRPSGRSSACRVDEDGMPWRFRHKAAFVFGHDPETPKALVMGHYAARIAAHRSRRRRARCTATGPTSSRSRSAISSSRRGFLRPARNSKAFCGTSSSARHRTTAKRWSCSWSRGTTSRCAARCAPSSPAADAPDRSAGERALSAGAVHGRGRDDPDCGPRLDS